MILKHLEQNFKGCVKHWEISSRNYNFKKIKYGKNIFLETMKRKNIKQCM